MIKKILILIISLNTVNFAMAEKYLVRITPCEVISTSKNQVQEGDYVKFRAINTILSSKIPISKDDIITGIVTQRQENDFYVKPAELYIEDFKTQNGISLTGIVYKKGSTYNKVLDSFFAVFTDFIRGSEAYIKPNEDIFTLEIEDK